MRLSIRQPKISICLAWVLAFLGPSVLWGQSNLPKVGLVLSGGGARGGAHIGILKILEREKVPIDYIAGTSFGALVGGFYALGYSAEEIEGIFLQQDWSKYFSDAPERRLSPLSDRKSAGYQIQLAFHNWVPELPIGLWEGQPLRELLNRLTTLPMLEAEYDFDRLPIPFRAVATDLVKGNSYVFSRGSMSEALRASIAIPLIFTPAR
jgi:NTE family protein